LRKVCRQVNCLTIVVADEPTGNLDTAIADEVFALFERLVNWGKTLLAVTYDQALSSCMECATHLRAGSAHRDESCKNHGLS
jgi:putative ABC transport system ATP-binding protein